MPVLSNILVYISVKMWGMAGLCERMQVIKCAGIALSRLWIESARFLFATRSSWFIPFQSQFDVSFSHAMQCLLWELTPPCKSVGRDVYSFNPALGSRVLQNCLVSGIKLIIIMRVVMMMIILIMIMLMTVMMLAGEFILNISEAEGGSAGQPLFTTRAHWASASQSA